MLAGFLKSPRLSYIIVKADLDVKLVLSTFKLRNMFSVKDSVPQGLRSRVVYKFSSAGCNASYIGETTRHLCTRVREHLLFSHVYRHCSHLALVTALVLQNVARSKRHCTLSGKIPFLISN